MMSFEVTINGSFSNDLLVLRDHCIAKIRELRPHERIDDYIREMAEI